MVALEVVGDQEPAHAAAGLVTDQRCLGRGRRPRQKQSGTSARRTHDDPPLVGAQPGVLEQLKAQDSPELVDKVFTRRGEARVGRGAERLSGLGFDARVEELTRILDEDGYLAQCRREADGSWLVVEHNCAILKMTHTRTRSAGSAVRTPRRR